MKTVKNGAAFISGGASGIGFGMAQALARHGMKIALADVDRDALDRATAALSEMGVAALPVTMDVRDRAAWEAALERTERELGPLQILSATQASPAVPCPWKRLTGLDGNGPST